MARGSKGKGTTARTETPPAQSQPSQATLPLPALPSDITMPISSTDSQDAQGLVNPSFSDGEKPSTQVTENRSVSAKSNKRSRKKAKNDKAQGQGSPILPLDNCGPMPATKTSQRGPSTTAPKPGSPPISPSLAFAEPTKAEKTLRQENEKLRRELEEAKCLTRGLKEANIQLGEEVEAWKQRCEGFSEAVKELRAEVEGIIDSRISKFFEKRGEEKEGEEEEGKGKEGEGTVDEGKKKGGKAEGDKEKERKGEEGKGKKRKEKERDENEGSKKEGKEGKEKEEEKVGGEDKDGKEGEAKARGAKLKVGQEENRQSWIEQIQDYRQRKKQEERRRKKWWTRFHVKLSPTFSRRVVMTLFLLGLIILLLAPVALIAFGEIQAYNRAHAQRIARLKLKESRSVQWGKAVAQFAADLSPEPIRGILYHWFLNDGWDLDEPYY